MIDPELPRFSDEEARAEAEKVFEWMATALVLANMPREKVINYLALALQMAFNNGALAANQTIGALIDSERERHIMADRIWTKAEPLNQAERSERFHPMTTITLIGAVTRLAIGRSWERDAAGEGATYGWAEHRTTERVQDTKFEMTVPFEVDAPGLARAILAELERQRAAPTIGLGQVIEPQRRNV